MQIMIPVLPARSGHAALGGEGGPPPRNRCVFAEVAVTGAVCAIGDFGDFGDIGDYKWPKLLRWCLAVECAAVVRQLPRRGAFTVCSDRSIWSFRWYRSRTSES